MFSIKENIRIELNIYVNYVVIKDYLCVTVTDKK